MPEVTRIINELLATNTYFCELKDKKCLVIDPGSDYERISAHLTKSALIPAAILLTHGHFDHVAGAVQLQREYPCKIYMNKKDLKTLKLSNFMMKMFGLEGKIEIPKVDIAFDDSHNFEFENQTVEFTLTPGHTYGSCVIKIDNFLFTGDTLFYTKVSSKIPNENPKQLIDSQNFILRNFNENLTILPGHGESALLKDVKKGFVSSIND